MCQQRVTSHLRVNIYLRKKTKKITKMKFLILAIITILHLSCISTRPLGHKKGGDFLSDLHLMAKQEGTMNIFSLKTILLNYVESKYPGMGKKRQAIILKVLAHKLKEKIFTEIRKKNLRSPWQEKENMLARMLK